MTDTPIDPDFQEATDEEIHLASKDVPENQGTEGLDE